MQNLSNESRTMLRNYEASLSALESMLSAAMPQLNVTLQGRELSYMNQNFNNMLANIRQQKTIISRNLLW